MSAFGCFRDAAWWKAYAIYLAIVTPLIVLNYLVMPIGKWAHMGVTTAIIFFGLSVKDRIRQKVWK